MYELSFACRSLKQLTDHLQNIKAKVINCPFKKLEIYMGSTVSFIIPIKFYAAIDNE